MPKQQEWSKKNFYERGDAYGITDIKKIERIDKIISRQIQQARIETIKEVEKGLPKENEIPQPKIEEDMEFHWNTGNHLSRCSNCQKAVSEYEDKFEECYCSFWNDNEDIITWKGWKNKPTNERNQVLKEIKFYLKQYK